MSWTSNAANPSISQIGQNNMMSNKITCHFKKKKPVGIQWHKWLVFCPHPFFQCRLLLKKATWTWISPQCQSRSCRLWANLPNLSRIWLTAACWSCIWKSGMTQQRDGNTPWVMRHWIRAFLGSITLMQGSYYWCPFFLTLNTISSVIQPLLNILSTGYIVNMVIQSLQSLWEQNDLDLNVYTSQLVDLRTVN